jgi:hypothetical protein
VAYAVRRRPRGVVSPTRRPDAAVRRPPSRGEHPAGSPASGGLRLRALQCGQLDGHQCAPGTPGVVAVAGRLPGAPSRLHTNMNMPVPPGAMWADCHPAVGGSPPAGAVLHELGIWLILPVVICLSQRLSHACLSISTLYCETANGSLNQLSFI